MIHSVHSGHPGHSVRAALRAAGVSALFAVSAHGAASSLQLYGVETAGSGGVAPRIWALDTAWPGNGGFGVTLDSAVGGGTAFLIVGSQPLDAYGPGFWVNVTPLLIGPAVPVSGAAGAPGVGEASLALPVPSLPALVGVDAFFQWAVVDAGSTFGYAATRGLRLTITDPPLVVVAGALGPNAGDPIYAIDPLSGTMANWSNLDENKHVALSPDGALAVVSASKVNQFAILETAGGTILGGVTTAGDADSVAITPDGKRAYCAAKSTSANPFAEVIEMDLDPASATFGQAVGTVTGFPPVPMKQWTGIAISGNGRILTLANFGLGEQAAVVAVDIDENSPQKNQVVKFVPVSTGGFVTDVVPDHDGTTAYASVQYLSPIGELKVVDLLAGTIPHTVGPIGGFPTDVELDPRGRFAYVACQLNGWVARIDVDENSAGYLTFTPSAFVAAAYAVALSPEGDRIYVVPQTGTDVTELDAGTLTITNVWPLPLSAHDFGVSVR